MATTIKKSRTAAIAYAKNELKKGWPVEVKRMSYVYLRPISAQCACGETQAIQLHGFTKNYSASIVVGICKECGE